MTLRADRLVPVAAELGEGPVWRSETAEILWVDILRGELHAADLLGKDVVLASIDQPVGAVALDEAGNPVLATPDGLIRPDKTVVATMDREAPDVRMNDGKPDPTGRFVGGTMTLGEPRPAAGALWSFDSSGSVRRLVAGATIANGIAWSSDGATMFWIDTPTRRVDAFDYDVDSGAISNRRPWVEISETVGSPDGMCIDAEGGLWVALWGGSAVHRYVDGVLDEVVELPTPLVTCPSFVGPDLDKLAITTAWLGFDQSPTGAGDLYLVDVGPIGLGPNRLGGWAR